MTSSVFLHPERIILVVTALSEERRSVIPFLDPESVIGKIDKYNREFITGNYYTSEDARPWHIVLPPPTSAGNAKSAAETALSLAVDPSFVFLLGVAGGFPTKVNMYDVVVAERVYDTDAAKIDDEGAYIPRPDQHKATSILLSRAKTLQDIGGWQKMLHPDLPNEDIEVWIEPIAAGSKLVASTKAEEFERIKQSAPRAVAVENEGFGVMQAAHEAAIAALVIRGISDLIDNRPVGSLVHEDSRVRPDHHKLKAARHASAFMFAIISRLTSSEIEEAAREDEEWVEVRLRWADLRKITRGRNLTLQILEGSPLRNLIGKKGSVEIEFRTARLVSAFLYAISLERSLFQHMIDIIPDQIDTKIDTSDPDVARIFSAVRMLASQDEFDRQQGEAEVHALANEHESLQAFAEKAMQASRKASSKRSSPDSLRGDTRISLSIAEGFREALIELAQLKNIKVGRAVKILTQSAIEQYRYSDVDLRKFILHDNYSSSKIIISISSQNLEEISQISKQIRAKSIEQTMQALVNYGIEMRLSELFIENRTIDQTAELRYVSLDVREVRHLRHEAGLRMSEIALSAGLSVSTVSRALRGENIQYSTAVSILDVLSKEINLELNDVRNFIHYPNH